MSQLLRFPSAVKRDPAIEAWMRERSDELGSIARRWFEVMRSCGNLAADKRRRVRIDLRGGEETYSKGAFGEAACPLNASPGPMAYSAMKFVLWGKVA